MEKGSPSSGNEENARRATKKVKNRDESLAEDGGSGGSFRDVLLNQTKSESGGEDLATKIEIGEEDVRVTFEGNTPVVEFSDKIRGMVAQAMQRSVVVRLLGNGIKLRTMYTQIMAQWQPQGDIRKRLLLGAAYDRKRLLRSAAQSAVVCFGHYVVVAGIEVGGGGNSKLVLRIVVLQMWVLWGLSIRGRGVCALSG